VARLARELRSSGHRVTVVTNRYPRSLARFERVDGVPVHRVLFPSLFVPRSAWRRTHLLRFALLLPLAPFALPRLWLLLRALRPGVVNVHYLSAPALYPALLSWLHLLPARLVVSCHGSDLTAAPYYPTGSRGASRRVLSHAYAVTTPSADLMGYVDKLVPDAGAQTRAVVYNGADADEFAGAAPAAPPAPPRPYILSVGHLTEEKGMHVLVEALALLRKRGLDRDLVIAGAGPEEDRLRRLAARLGLADRVRLLGTVERADLGALYRGCAVFALASAREGFGIVVLEAMSCARPVVATRAGGIPETVLDGETGLLARVGDPGDVADKLAALLADPARAAEMGRRGRERVVAEYTWPLVAARYLATYRPLFAGSADDLALKDHGRDRTLKGQYGVNATQTFQGPSPAMVLQGQAHGPTTVLQGQAHGPTIWKGRSSRDAVPILMYHQVAPETAMGVKRGLLVTPQAFAAQMRLLRRLGWRTLRLADLAGLLDTRSALPRRRFVLTFDDAFLGVLRHAAPTLEDLGFTATVFAPTGLLGDCRAPDGGPDHEDKRLMGWDDLRAWRSLGHDVGAHTRGHPHLPALARRDPDAVLAEVAGPRTDIAAALGEAPALFAYPYGEWDRAVESVVEQAGYAAACTTRFGRVTDTSHRFALPRISISADLDLPHFAYRLARADHIARAIARGPAGTETGAR